jgi:O-antigen ligase
MRHARGLERYLYGCAVTFLGVCVVMTISRGPLLALSGGTLYFVWKRWIGLKGGMAIGLVSFLAFATFGQLSFLRVLTTLYEILPLDVFFPLPTVGTEILEDIYDPHKSSIAESLSYIAVNPFFGMGRFLFQALGDMSFGNEHNNYLNVAASYGLPALVTYLMFLLVLFVLLEAHLAKTAQDSKVKDMGTLLGGGMVALLIYLNGSPAEFHFIWIWFGFAGAWIANQQRLVVVNDVQGRERE